MSSVPNYASSPLSPGVTISTANTARDGTGTLGTVVTAPATGARIEEIVITASVTTTAGMVRLFIFDGTTNRLYAEVPVAAITVGASTPAFTARLSPANLFLQANHQLRASTHNAESFNVFAFGGSF